MAKGRHGARHLVRVQHTHEWIETTRDGRKVASSSDLLELSKVKGQIRKLRMKLREKRPDLMAPARNR